MTEERVQKALSRMGFGSRREIEQWIEQGRVRINGETVKLGDKAKEGDRAEFNGKRIVIRPAKAEVRVLMYNKPVGEICSRKDEKGRKSVFDHLPKITNARWVSVGRLDFNTSGLLLFTSNGELANRLAHPSHEVEREYVVRIRGQATKENITQLKKGVQLDDGLAAFDEVEDLGGQGSNHSYRVVLREGRNREVRRLWEAVGITVSRLMRVRYANLLLPAKLRQGKYVDLQQDEVKDLMNLVGLKLDEKGISREASRKKKNQRYKKSGY